jgi:hypothetical protein
MATVTTGRALALASVIVFLVTLWSLGSLDNTYVTYPRVPDKSSGRIVAYPVKGIVVYVTPAQHQMLSGLAYAEYGSLVALTILIVVSGGRAVSFTSSRQKPNS